MLLRLSLLRRPWTRMLLCLAPLWLCSTAPSQEPAPPSPPPVTTRNDALGKLVNGWFAEGSAAGNRGDHYDNRDGGHSRLKLDVYPQLQPVPYTEEELAQRRNHGPAAAVLPFPTLGNASLSAPATEGGSLPRIICLTPNGLRLLQTSYLANNLYIYPEHQDHDPLHGDLYPLNSPYLVISQGSSSSDQPFLEAFTLTLASFQPEVKTELIRSRLLVPTLQFILRSSLKPVHSREDYLSGVAHPAVFPPEWIDPERMARMAHQMIRATIPPLVQLELVSESPAARSGIDFFEPPALSSEALANEASVIGRVCRNRAPERVLRVSAARTADLLGRPLRVTWRLLRGDPSLVTIQASPSGHEAEIRVRHHPRPLPVPGQPDIRSTRIDIGAFADNGISLSAPAFVSIYQIPSEERVYDDGGRLVQIDYQAPSRYSGLPPANSFRWAPFLERIWDGRSDWAGHFLAKVVTAEERAALSSPALQLQPLIASKRQLESQLQTQQETLAGQRSQVQQLKTLAQQENDPVLLAEAERQSQDLQMVEKATHLRAATTRSGITSLERDWEATLRSLQVDGRPLPSLLSDIVNRLVDAPDLYPANHALLAERAKSSPKPGAATRLDRVRQRLIDRRILLVSPEAPNLVISFAPLAKPENRFYLRALNRTILSEVLLPDVLDYSFADELADPRLTIPKPWRDVFLYHPDTGQLQGWQRIQKGEATEYDPAGRLLTATGPVSVQYVVNPQSKTLEVVAPAAPPSN